MDIKDIHRIYEDFEAERKINPVVEQEPVCKCEYVQENDIVYCKICGEVESFGGFVPESDCYGLIGSKPRRPAYKRVLHCKDRLSGLCCSKTYNKHKEWREMIEEVKKHEFETPKELKYLLKDLKLTKFNNWLYNIWFDIKGTRAIDISYNDQMKIAHQFIYLEDKFKNDKKGRSNLHSYVCVIYYLMKKNKIKGYRNLVLPLNHKKVLKSLKSIDNK